MLRNHLSLYPEVCRWQGDERKYNAFDLKGFQGKKGRPFVLLKMLRNLIKLIEDLLLRASPVFSTNLHRTV
jgi:hypothetical protein